MNGDDADTWLAYYCFVNRGWAPSQYDALPYREKVLVAEFVHHEVEAREKQAKELKAHKGRRR